jgi:hypothetical protein
VQGVTQMLSKGLSTPTAVLSNGFRSAAAEHPISSDGLVDSHRNRLSKVITAEMIEARGYKSVIQRRALPPEYKDYQRRTGLFIARWPVLLNGPDGSQLRPEHPRLREGKQVKYETPAGQLNALDAHPFIKPLLGKSHVPLWVTEGIIKSDAAVAAGLCCVSLCGVWNWRGARERGGAPLALPDWDGIALKGRLAILAFDADVLTKRPVYDALVRLKGFLERKGADVRILYLEHGDLEDYFADGYARVA